MWNGDPGSWTASAASSAAWNGSPSVNAPSLVACMWAKSSTGPHPAGAARDLEHVVERAEVAHAAHHLDAEGNGSILPLEPFAELAQLLDDGVEGVLASALEQEAGMEDHHLGVARLRDSRRVVEHADRHVQLLAALGVAHEARERRVDGERDVVLAGELAEPRGEVVVHPEARLEVDLAGGVAALQERARPPARGSPGRARGPARSGFRPCNGRYRFYASPPSDAVSTVFHMAKRPSRVDLLELDIDLRLADLWRELSEINEWNMEIAAAFMRAAYGKGYCDALTEDDAGSLCLDHGYRLPAKRDAQRS